MEKTRLDKWLWAARFYKTRSLAAREIRLGRVLVNGQEAKAARELAIDDYVHVRKSQMSMTVRVLGLSSVRGPASVARLLYEETAESMETRERLAEQRRLAPEPAGRAVAGRPTKRERRELDRLRGRR